MSAISILEELRAHKILYALTLGGVMTFTRLASHLKRDILQPQQIQESDPGSPPAALPPNIASFLSVVLGTPLAVVQDCWSILRYDAWAVLPVTLTVDDYRLFRLVGWSHKLSEKFLAVEDLIYLTSQQLPCRFTRPRIVARTRAAPTACR